MLVKVQVAEERENLHCRGYIARNEHHVRFAEWTYGDTGAASGGSTADDDVAAPYKTALSLWRNTLCPSHSSRLDPPVVSSGPTFRLWLCRMHNRVNARLGKPTFNCDLVERRWAPLGCSAEEEAAGEAAGRGGGVSDPGCQLLGVGSRWTGGIRR